MKRPTVYLKPLEEEHHTNPHHEGFLSWQQFHTIRNELVDACKCFGRVGPVGMCEITDASDGPDILKCQSGDMNPQFYIINDQYNHDCYLFVELYGSQLFSVDWLCTMISFLERHGNWGIGIANIPKAYLLIFSKSIYTKGIPLIGLQDMEDLVSVVNSKFRRKSWWHIW